MNRWWALGFCLIAAAGLALRCLRLDNRPMHNDEAVNALKLGGHWSTNSYRYDPNEHHGPTLYYSSLLPVWLSGTRSLRELSETTMRLTPALFGVGLVLLLWPLRDGLGKGTTLAAALLTALSPGMVFYSRDYIHEMLLAFFTLLALVGGWRYAQGRGAGWAMTAGAGLGLMYATKETFVFSVVAMCGAVVATAFMESFGGSSTTHPCHEPEVAGRARLSQRAVRENAGPGALGQTRPTSRFMGRGREGVRRLITSCKASHLAAAAVVALVVSGILFTSFFTNWSGPVDSLRTYLPWLKRAGGESPHIHPWYFYFERLAFFQRPKGPVWSEGLILALGAVGMIAALKGRWLRDADRRLARFLTFYTLGLTFVYSAVSYKTPWCLLGFLHGFILLAGIGVVALFELARHNWMRAALGVVLLAATAHLAWQAWQASFARFADWRNPYVYAQTVPDLLRLTELVQHLAETHPAGQRMLVKVVAPKDDYWPLPYYLRSLEHVGWYRSLPEDPYAPVIVCAAQLAARLDDASNKRWLMAGMFELRPQVFLELYVEFELWKKWIEVRGPVAE